MFIKVKFKCAMKQTIEYTHNLLNSDGLNKVPMEQRICLLKVNDSVKEKAMMKLKEIKSKSDDSTSKARQWLDGLLKIPFHIYKEEPIFNIMKNNIFVFKRIVVFYVFYSTELADIYINHRRRLEKMSKYKW